MTAVPADQAAISRLVAALEHAWAAIRSHHPEVPQVVIVVASGSDPRSQRLTWVNSPPARASPEIAGDANGDLRLASMDAPSSTAHAQRILAMHAPASRRAVAVRQPVPVSPSTRGEPQRGDPISSELLGLVGGVRFSPVSATAFVFGLLLLGAGAGAGRGHDLAQHRVADLAG